MVLVRDAEIKIFFTGEGVPVKRFLEISGLYMIAREKLL